MSTRQRCVVSLMPRLYYPHGRDAWYPLSRRVMGLVKVHYNGIELITKVHDFVLLYKLSVMT
jgi:hypothetical protein